MSYFKDTTIQGNLIVNANTIALGFLSGNTTGGINNVNVGGLAGGFQTGSYNVNIGYDAGANGIIQYTGTNNTVVGYNSGMNSSTTTNGTAIGANSLVDMSGTAVGAGATAIGTNNIAIGVNATTGNWGNSMAIGTNSQVTSSVHLGDFNIQTTNVDNSWKCVTFGSNIPIAGGKKGLFAAVSYDGSYNRVINSTDAMNWNVQSVPNADPWNCIISGTTSSTGTYPSETPIFVAVSPLVYPFTLTPMTFTSRVSTSDINWTSITYGAPSTGTNAGKGLFAAIGNNSISGIMTSLDGVTWTAPTLLLTSLNWTSIAYGSGRFVAVASNPTINNLSVVSTDGSTWSSTGVTMRTSSFTSVVYGNTFAAVDVSGVSISPTGVTWTRQTTILGSSGFLNAGNTRTATYTGITYGAPSTGTHIGKNMFVAVGQQDTSGILTCVADGVTTWRRAAPLTISAKNWTGITYGSPSTGQYAGMSMFVAVASNDTNGIMTSTDGSYNWTLRSCPSANWNGITYGNGLFVAVSSSGTGNRVMASSDAINWSLQTSAADYTWNAIAYGSGRFAAVSSSGVGNRIMTYESNRVMISNNGNTWSTANMTGIDQNKWVSVTCGTPASGSYTGGNIFIAVSNSGTSNRVMLSQNSNTWVTSGITGVPDISYTSITYGNGTFVAVADASYATPIITSSNGTTWASVAAPVNNNWSSVIYGTVSTGLYDGSGVFVAVAYGGTTNRVMTSINAGATWVSRQCPVSDWYSVGYGTDSNGKGYFVAVSYSGLAMASTDTVNWYLVPTPAKNQWSGITYGVPVVGSYAGQGVFAAVSTTGTNRVMTSSFGDSTTVSSLSIGNKAYANGESTIAIGEGARVSGSQLGQFTLQTGATVANSWRSVISGVVTATGRTRFVAVAAIGTNRVYYSDDGVTWTATSANYDTNVWQSITYGVPTMGTYANVGLFVAVASTVTTTGTAVMTSIDGITWTPQNTTGFDYPWFSVTFGQISTGTYAGMGAFVAVAYAQANRLMWSYDGVNWLNTNTSVTNTAVWSSITYGVPSSGRYQGLGTFVAIANSGAGSGTRLMFSTDLSGWTTITTSAPDLSWNAITYGTPSTGPYKDQGVFVAVSKSGKGNRVMTTTDLSTCSVVATLDNTWNTSTYDNSWNAIGYGNGYFIAVGGVGGSPLISRVMTSTDAINWTLQKTPGDLSWNAITYGVPSIGQYAGQGIFVALSSGNSGSNRVMTAVFTDVYKNNSAAIGNGALTTGNNSMAIGVGAAVLGDNSVAYGVGASVTGNSSIAMGSSAIVKSPFHLGDWKAYIPCSSGSRIIGVTYGNGLFVAVLFYGTSPAKVITSPDGINWTFRQAIGAINWGTVTYGIPSTGQYAGQGLFVALSWANTPGLMTSPDGINWTVRNATNVDGRYFLRMEYGNGTFVGFASNTATSGNTFFVYSTDGITWTNCTNSPTSQDWWDCTAYGNGYFVALGQTVSPRAYRSPDGITWTSVTLPINAAWRSMAFGNGVFVALSLISNICMVSPDGLNWTVYQPPVIQEWYGMSFGNGLFVVVSVTTPNNVSMVSPDGINWTVKQTPIDSSYRCMTYGTVNGVGTFVSFQDITSSTSPYVMVASFEDTKNSIAIGQSASVNGSGSIAIGANAKVSGSQLSSFINRVTPIDTLNVTLSDVDSGIPSTGPYQGQTLFIAISSSITGGGINNRIIISLDTVNWFPVSVPVDLAYSGIVWGIPSTGQYAGQGLFVVVASTITASQIITSPDGITWTIRTSPVSGFALQDIAFGNGTFVAVSNVTAGSTRVLRSPDGITWSYPTSLTYTTTNTWVSITFGNGIFVAVGTTVTSSPSPVTECTMYSADNGNSWTLESSLSNRPITSIAYGIASTGQLQGQGVFVNVTNDGYIRYSRDLSKYGWLSGDTPDNLSVYNYVTYGNGTFIAISSNNYIATSTTGLGWTYSYYVGSMISMIYGIPSSGPFVNQSVFVMTTSATTGTKIATANFIDTNVSNSIAIGNGAIASGNNSISIGNGAISTIDNIVVIGNINNTINVPGKPFFNGGFVQGVFNNGNGRCMLVPVLTNANSMNITFVGTLNGISSTGGLALPYQAYGQYFVYMQFNLNTTSATANQEVSAVIIPSSDSANVNIGGYKTYTYATTSVYTGSDTFSITHIHNYSTLNDLQYLYFYAGVTNLANRPFSEDTQYSYIEVVQI